LNINPASKSELPSAAETGSAAAFFPSFEVDFEEDDLGFFSFLVVVEDFFFSGLEDMTKDDTLSGFKNGTQLLQPSVPLLAILVLVSHILDYKEGEGD
jgi:hypothetical protein